MTKHSIENIFNQLENRLKSLFSSKNWFFVAILLAFSIAIFFYVGLNYKFAYLRLKGLYLHQIGMSQQVLSQNGYTLYFGQFIQEQAQDLFKKRDLDPFSHEANMTFRFVLPLTAKIFHLNIIGLFLFQFFVMGYIYFQTILKLANRIFREKTFAFYFLLGILGLYMGNVILYDVGGYGDTFGYCFLILSIFFRSPILVFLFSLLAFFTDERALIASSFTLIWWFFEESESFEWKNSIKPQIFAVSGSWIIYFIIRFSLQKIYGLSIPTGSGTGINFDTLVDSLGWLGAKIWQVYEIYVFMLALVIYILIKNRLWFLLLAISGAFFISFLTSLIVVDTTRSLSFTVILMFISARILKNNLEKNELKYLLMVSAFASVVYPMFF